MDLDDWLDNHPRVDRVYIATVVRARGLKWRAQLKLEQRHWRPGMFYLDHGSEPCVLIRIDDDALTGVSLVDGRIIGGCSIHHCGPEPTTEAEAREAAHKMLAQRRDRVIAVLAASDNPHGITLRTADVADKILKEVRAW